jgi:hypothetical protein
MREGPARGLYRYIAWDVTRRDSSPSAPTEDGGQGGHRAQARPDHGLRLQGQGRGRGLLAPGHRLRPTGGGEPGPQALGGWHEVALAELGRLAAAISRHTTGQPEEEASQHLFGRLSVLLMRGNAALFSNRIPDHIDPQILKI